ncbi:unnamed protein product [Blepharisma stoltei]|uniref:Uncharacterized protein n=1 Tax=Blepharisma stoltei TaxID=1481888 RepID=A0AAU9KDD0_9CILI|nr:unnamed protein product [Blepharisma stoltei]
MSRKFDEHICGCFTEMCSCLIAFCIPFGTCGLQAYAINKSIGEGYVIPFVIPIFGWCIGSAINREQIRKKYHIESDFCKDCLFHTFLNPCAAAQEYREAVKVEERRV